MEELGSNDINRKLFSSLLLPEAHDGELLYSWGARFHRLSGNHSARETSRQLFGNSTAGLRHDFCGCLNVFQEKTHCTLGTTEKILRKRTLTAFYLPFISHEKESKLRQLLINGTGASARHILGLPRAGFSSQSLKACPECMQQDLEEQPTSWWRTDHQWPSTFVCDIHQRPLSVFSIETRRSALADWYLPTPNSPHSWREYRLTEPKVISLLLRLNKWAAKICLQDTLRFEEDLLRHTYLLQAKECGWLSPDGTVRLIQLRDAFFEEHKILLNEPVFSFIQDTQETNFGFLGLLLRQYPGQRHPLRHLLLMAFLFKRPEDFLNQYRKILALWEEGGRQAMDDQLHTTYRHLRSLVKEQEKSVTAAAAELGISSSQAARHLTANNINYKKRPRVVNTETEPRLIAMLEAGKNRGEIVQSLGIKRTFIKTYLSERPELRTVWEKANFEIRREAYRKKFLETLSAYPSLPIKRIRLIPGNGFQWLYNNDYKWLREQLPSIWKRC